jgi:hypothetical protein
LIIPSKIDIKTSGGGEGSGENSGNIGINFTYIENITKLLSEVVFRYEGNELAKGRYFGSEGEQYAARYILKPKMIEMGLYNPCSGKEPYLEKIENIKAVEYLKKSPGNLTDDLQPLSYGITIYEQNGTNTTNTTLTDFHIEPNWNLRLFYGVAKSILDLLRNNDF